MNSSKSGLGSKQQTGKATQRILMVLKKVPKGNSLRFFSSTSKSSPPNKSLRFPLPGKKGQDTRVRKSLEFDNSTKQGEFSKPVHFHVLTQCNVNDLDTFLFVIFSTLDLC